MTSTALVTVLRAAGRAGVAVCLWATLASARAR